MNVEIRTVAAQFLFWEYLFQIFGIVSLQCTVYGCWKKDIRHIFKYLTIYAGTVRRNTDKWDGKEMEKFKVAIVNWIKNNNQK
jgi:hypothetical protein